jgi:hypothetical protein
MQNSWGGLQKEGNYFLLKIFPDFSAIFGIFAKN